MNFNDIIVMNEEEYLENENMIESHILKNKNLLIEWCTSNYNLFNNNVYGNKQLFTIGMEFLLNSNRKYTENDIKFIITYFAKEAIKDMEMDNVHIKFSDNLLFSDYSCAHYDKKKKEITFYLNKFSNLNDDDLYLVNGIMSIFEEIYRIKQQKELKSGNEDFSIEDYAIILEYICSYERGYYRNNYNKSIKENKAKIYALNKLNEHLSILKPNIKDLNDDDLNELHDMYNFNIDEGIKYKFKELDRIATDIISRNTFFAKEYPSLCLGYELEGTPKDLTSLKEDYKYFLNVYPNKKDSIDNFYKVLIGHRYDIDEEELEKISNPDDLGKKSKERLRLIER